jgi:ribose transport system permease protein
MTMSDQTGPAAAPRGNVTGAQPVPEGPQPASAIRGRLHWLGSRYALIGVWILLAAVYAGLMPHLFLQVSTAQAIFGSQSPLLFLAIAALCTFVVGEFDLSFAGVMGLSATIIPVLSGLHHVNLALSCLIALAACITCGVDGKPLPRPSRTALRPEHGLGHR